MFAVLDDFAPITLDEMDGIRLMNRTDTKFVVTVSLLRRLLNLAVADYRVQDIHGERLSPYYTLYFDTMRFDMYRRHVAGHANRQKLRIRSYVSSNLNFLEVKTKNNHGRTRKRRMAMEGFDPMHPDRDMSFDATCCYAPFLHDNLRYDMSSLRECIENRFNRITLVNNCKTERLTIDNSLSFHNLITGNDAALPNIAIVELKRDGLAPSPILAMLRQLRAKPLGFSKYCIGSALTNGALPHGRIKERVRAVEKLENSL